MAKIKVKTTPKGTKKKIGNVKVRVVPVKPKKRSHRYA